MNIMLLVDAAIDGSTTTTLGFVIMLGVLFASAVGGVLASRLLQGRSIRDLEEWRDDTAKPQLKTLMTEHDYTQRRAQEKMRESSSQSTTQGETNR